MNRRRTRKISVLGAEGMWSPHPVEKAQAMAQVTHHPRLPLEVSLRGRCVTRFAS